MSMFLRIISERVEPGEHAGIALPRWLAAGYGWNGDLLQGFPFRFQIGPGIVVGRVEADMAEPASNDRNVDAGGDEVHGGGVPEGVRRHMLGTQCWRGFARCFHVGGKFEPDARCAERFAIADRKSVV